MEMEAKHTPGPWKVHKGFTSVGPYNKGLMIGPNQRALAHAIGEFEKADPGDEARANARLIAAAPDLLAALRNLTIWRDKDHPEHDAFCEAEADHAAACDEFPHSEKVEARLIAEARAALSKATAQ
jgi:hypothetical protein